MGYSILWCIAAGATLAVSPHRGAVTRLASIDSVPAGFWMKYKSYPNDEY